MGTRLSVYGLSDEQKEKLRAAWDSFKRITDDRGYNHFAGIHGLPFPIQCKHSPRDSLDLLFLPWHRAFLYFFERALQDIDPDVSIPWWEWSSARAHAEGLPDFIGTTRTETGEPNPFHHATVDWPTQLRRFVRERINGLITASGRTRRDPEPPSELPQEATVQDILTAPNFEDFSLRLENVHGAMHVWVGGAMSQVPAAAYDPVFWIHHATIDRLWYLWQISRFGENPPNDMLDMVLDPFPMTVRETLSIHNLGYDYAVQQVES